MRDRGQRDVLGKASEAFWREMVMAWRRSGHGARRFCREQGLGVSNKSRITTVLDLGLIERRVARHRVAMGSVGRLIENASPKGATPNTSLGAL
ncbi:IS66 family insertion sequence element accessory protein TnpA [Caballeronia arationis]|uniref:IS66 family insertion sequence element accessory protein TnpA n=1 Tax=Caballeronia arationis TaxID=1777142 RepID=UPI0040419716